MNFEPDPEATSAVHAVRTWADGALSTLPRAPADFARAADAGLAGVDRFATSSLGAAAAAVGELAVSSSALAGVAFARWLVTRAGRDGFFDGASGRELFKAGLGAVALATPSFRATASVGGVTLDGATGAVPLAPLATYAVVLFGDRHAPRAAVTSLTGVLATPVAMAGLGLGEIPWATLAFAARGTVRATLVDDGGARVARLFDAHRILCGAWAVGLARRCFEIARAAVAGRDHASQSAEFSISDVATDVDAAALAVSRAAWLSDRGGAHPVDSAAAKAFATAAAVRSAYATLSIHGEQGDADATRRCYLDAQFLELFGGGRAEQEDAIASVMLEE
jgi:alkylation response protein AidB-like acyl-CoA dehydrogenase